MAGLSATLRSRCATRRAGDKRRRLLLPMLVLAAIVPMWSVPLAGQVDGTALLTGMVVDRDGKAVAGATVKLHGPAAKDIVSETDASGAFGLKTSRQAHYDLSVDTVDHRHGELTVAEPGSGLRIVVKALDAPMEFTDKPDFTVAGVTDWTAVGGHGSDATLRTSEDLARATAELKDVGSAGEVDESRGDPLGAVRAAARAAALKPSEANYLAWGSELLVHRAIWQAAEVFAKGARLHPESQRLKTGWGAALFGEAKYDEAAERLCEASDLDASNRETYLFLGKVGLGSPSPAACVGEKLGRFVRLRPEDADANYYVGMMLLKGGDRERAGALLRKAVALKPGFAEGYLQLGILALGQRDNAGAQADFERAIAADGSLAEAHYRLGVVYDRTGRSGEAKAEFARHEALVNEQAEAVERERRQVKQFLVVLGDGRGGADAGSLRE